jgi:drug/metabolite transporter (DMT)-like permease
LFLWLTGRIKYDGDPALQSAIVATTAFALIASLYGWHAGAGEDELMMAGIGLVLGLLGQVLPTLLFTIGIPTIGSSLASTLGAAELPVAVVAAWLIAGESIGTMQVLGIVLILCGIVLAERRSGGKPRKAPRLGE